MKNLYWLPIDLPKFEYSQEIINDFKREFIPPTAKSFLAQRLTTHAPNYGVASWQKELTESQTKLKEYIDQYMPFDKLVNIKVHHPHKQGNVHIDFATPDQNLELFEHNQSVEPCGYRLVFAGNRYGDNCVITNSGTVYPTLPEDTDWYVVGHTNVPHSITHACPDRYILFCHAWINKDKHYELLERSLAKYKDYAVWNS